MVIPPGLKIEMLLVKSIIVDSSPILVLFLIWFLTKKLPTLGAWIGTVLAIVGTGLIFIY